MLGGVGLVTWRLTFTKQAQKDAEKLAAAGMNRKAENLLNILRVTLSKSPRPTESLLAT
jgi:hypothetical protein